MEHDNRFKELLEIEFSACCFSFLLFFLSVSVSVGLSLSLSVSLSVSLSLSVSDWKVLEFWKYT